MTENKKLEAQVAELQARARMWDAIAAAAEAISVALKSDGRKAAEFATRFDDPDQPRGRR